MSLLLLCVVVTYKSKVVNPLGYIVDYTLVLAVVALWVLLLSSIQHFGACLALTCLNNYCYLFVGLCSLE